MLYPQIPKTILDKIAGELNINTGLFNITLKESQESDKTLYDKLKFNCQIIEKQYNIGTIDSQNGYFKGILPMRWGRMEAWQKKPHNWSILGVQLKKLYWVLTAHYITSQVNKEDKIDLILILHHML